MELPEASGAVFTEDQRTNLYYLNDLYAKIARYVSHQLRERSWTVKPWMAQTSR